MTKNPEGPDGPTEIIEATLCNASEQEGYRLEWQACEGATWHREFSAISREFVVQQARRMAADQGWHAWRIIHFRLQHTVASELTPEGEQYLMPGTERQGDRDTRKQRGLWG